MPASRRTKSDHDGRAEHKLIRRFDDLSQRVGVFLAVELALDHPGLGFGGPALGLGDAKVDELGGALVADHEVLRADVAVDDVQGIARGVGFAVGVVQTFATAGNHVQQKGQGQLLFGFLHLFLEGTQVEARDVLHELEIEVTNVWNNRLVGDQSLDEKDRVTRTNMLSIYKKKIPLVPSGLLGPVTLEPVTSK